MGTPVTTFKRSNRLYRLNKGLDRDKDGIASEKR
jgi:Excalibur calcium-binding domain